MIDAVNGLPSGRCFKCQCHPARPRKGYGALCLYAEFVELACFEMSLASRRSAILRIPCSSARLRTEAVRHPSLENLGNVSHRRNRKETGPSMSPPDFNDFAVQIVWVLPHLVKFPFLQRKIRCSAVMDFLVHTSSLWWLIRRYQWRCPIDSSGDCVDVTLRLGVVRGIDIED